MSSSDRHADHEALSGFVDGEAPEWADHVSTCAACQASAAELRAVSAAVGGPVDRPPAATREAGIAAALDAFPAPAAAAAAASPVPDRLAVERERVARRRIMLPSWAMPAVAAVVVGLLGVSGFLVASGNRSTDETTTFAGPALESDAKAGGSSGLAAATPAIPATDLGEVPDPATLLARARTGFPATTAESLGALRSSATNSGSTSDSSAPGAPLATSGSSGAAVSSGTASGGAGGAVSPNAVGTRPCEERVRAREPALGPVVYFATARRSGVEAYVLGFTTLGGPSPITLVMLAQDGCRELLRAAGP